MFTGIVSGIGRIVDVRPLGADAAFGKALTIEAPAGWLGSTAHRRQHRARRRLHDRRLDRRRARSLPGRGLGREPRRAPPASTPPATSTSRRRCAPATGSTAIWSAATSTASAPWLASSASASRGSCAVAAPPALARFLALKGSIAVDGVSLTVNRVVDSAAACEFSVNLIPHTVAAHDLARPRRRPPRQPRGRPDRALCRAHARGARRLDRPRAHAPCARHLQFQPCRSHRFPSSSPSWPPAGWSSWSTRKTARTRATWSSPPTTSRPKRSTSWRASRAA